jgi:WD40-like Beta Propeller Repeat
VRASLLLVLALAVAAIPVGAAGRSTQPASRYLVTAQRIGSQQPPNIEVVSAAGRLERVVARPGSITTSEDARWSPDGSMLAWTGNAGVGVERADGSARRLLVRPGRSVEIASPGPSTKYFVVGWTADGRSLVYERSAGNANSPSCCRLDVRVTTTDGRRTRVAYRFPDPFYKGSFPSLAPDGRTIAYMTPSDDGSRDLIRVVDLETGASHAIGGLGVLMDQAPAWLPDSRRFAIARLYRQAVTVALDGAHLRALGPRASGVYSGRAGGIIMVRGAGEVWSSRAGEPARFLFRLPHKLGIAAIDAL